MTVCVFKKIKFHNLKWLCMWIEVTDFNDGDRFPGSKIVRLGELNVLIVNQVHLYHTAVLKQLFLLFLSLQSLFFSLPRLVAAVQFQQTFNDATLQCYFSDSCSTVTLVFDKPRVLLLQNVFMSIYISVLVLSFWNFFAAKLYNNSRKTSLLPTESFSTLIQILFQCLSIICNCLMYYV